MVSLPLGPGKTDIWTLEIEITLYCGAVSLPAYLNLTTCLPIHSTTKVLEGAGCTHISPLRSKERKRET